MAEDKLPAGLGAHHRSGIHDGAQDLVVPRAAAKIAREPITRLFLGRVEGGVEQRLGGDDQARRAEAALQRRMLEEFLLHRVQLVAFGDAFDRRDGAALGLDAEHQARADDIAVADDRAGAAVARATAFLAAGEAEFVAQHVEHRLLSFAEILHRLAVDRGRDVMLAHQGALLTQRAAARSKAMVAVRRARTPATLVRYSIVPRLSVMGLQAACAAASSAARVGSSSLWLISALAASSTMTVVGATAPSTTRASVQTPLASSVTLVPQPTTAISISVRGIKRRYESH